MFVLAEKKARPENRTGFYLKKTNALQYRAAEITGEAAGSPHRVGQRV